MENGTLAQTKKNVKMRVLEIFLITSFILR